MQLDTNSLWFGDNLAILEAFPSESVDLIYLDPPYNSKRNYNVTFGAVAQSKAFEDTWTWGEDDDRQMKRLAKVAPRVNTLLQSLEMLLSKRGLLPYLVNMATRLVELHRVLKPTGSIYLHVDPTASHYLKLVMDMIFGGGNFRNEILWCYSGPANCTRHFPKKHDAILFYTKSDGYTFNQQRVPHKSGLHNKGTVFGRRVEDDQAIRRKEAEGKLLENWWTDIPSGAHISKHERLGYPTQKPLALLERIILASSDEGDVVLDPYMGSGTTIEAAARHGRQWIGIDVTHHAVAATRSRLEDCGIELSREQLFGVPMDTESARHFKASEPRQFDAWCVLQCQAAPQDIGNRIVGIRTFPSIAGGREHTRRALYMATTDDPPTMEDLKGCVQLMKKHGCEIGFLYCFEMPSDPAVHHFLLNQSTHTDDNRNIPCLQLITIRDLLHGKTAANLVSEWRQRRLRDLSKQMELV